MSGTYRGIRDRPEDEWFDLGNGCRYKHIINGDDNDVAGIIHEFPDGCRALLFFRGKGTGQAEWDVLQEDPLTLHPSLKVTAHNLEETHEHHGWIRNGRWEEEA